MTSRPWLRFAYAWPKAPFAQEGAPRKNLRLASPSWLTLFVAFQLICQLALLSSALAPLRFFLRTAAFGAALLPLLLPARGKSHPSAGPACAILAIVALSLLHPDTRPLSGFAQAVLYLAILAPVFWASRVRTSVLTLRNVFLLLLVFHAASAATGLLQTLFPGSFQPPVSAMIERQGRDYVESLRITLDSGARVFRPMGLTDVPGGAAVGGLYALLLGLGFFLTTDRVLARVACFAAMSLGMTMLYLCHVRSIIVRIAISLVALVAVFIWKKRFGKFLATTVLGLAIVIASLAIADALASRSVTQRLATFFETNPAEVYYRSRGTFLEYTIQKLLPAYPLGAGLGRWGMTNAYFGGKQDPSLWVEVQWTGWLLDGGVPLVLAYAVALAVAFVTAARIRSGRSDELWIWGSIVFAYDAGAVANTFAYPVFAGQDGLEFWFLNAIVFAAATQLERSEHP